MVSETGKRGPKEGTRYKKDSQLRRYWREQNAKRRRKKKSAVEQITEVF